MRADGTNTITVNNAVNGQEYKLYKMLDLVVDEAHTAYSYTVNREWSGFFQAAAGQEASGAGLTYVNIDEQGYVSWKAEGDIAAFAKAAETFAAKLDAVSTIEPTTDGSITFSDLEPGYYLVTSTLGTKAMVATTPGTPNAEIQEKNKAPSNEKTVEEDSTGSYGNSNDADIGQTVNFKSTITAQPGAENYVFVDTMSAGLTYKEDAKVYTNPEMTEELDKGNYDVNGTLIDGATFTIAFEQSYLDTITAETKLYVKYSATLNENADVGMDGNTNTSKLKYGDSANPQFTPDSKTTTYTWDMEVLKFGNNKKENVLSGAKFVLLNEDATKVATVADGKITDWVDVPTGGNDGTISWPENTILTTGADGKIDVAGLDADKYLLREIEAPVGYNKLSADQEFTILGAQKAGDNNELTYTKVTAEVNNQSGTELPSTGGMGTTLFYVLGGILVVGAGILLVTKKRMDRA